MIGHVFDIQRFSVHDGPGIRTTVFLAGCPLRCAWCHNPEAFAGSTARSMRTEDVLAEVLEDRAYYETSGGGVTVSGGEPLLQASFVRELLGLAKREGLRTCVQTAGAVPSDAVRAVLDVVDLFQFDVKHMDPERHRALTGARNERILENAALLVASGANVEFRVPVVPGHNDEAANLERTAVFLATIGVKGVQLVPYQRTYLGKYEQLGLEAKCAHVAPPSARELEDVARAFAARGVVGVIEG